MMDQAKMQQMMQQMQNMQRCMQGIDQAEMKALEQRGRTMEAELRGLCAQGKREEAQTAALEFAMETAENSALQTMKKCGEQMQGLLPDLPLGPSRNDLKDRHVCDGMQ
ncbi:hypothetical protein Q9L42_020080 [Methylomarinum sp. Ch1-1]|uniref:Uncharacterized protein n=1 Tax=Methylomarinum roseum TaxID=3067653 RepID=A0AAU7NUD6_9GAMM|nr:hypothetical protein [Methylomarinum sp. Ch1-1]MDP4519312.1 hypothetical protein [Methylomarinum sp. Ch1-1]